MIKGGCRCGEIKYKINGDAKFQVQCHCTECQKLTGSGHAPIMIFGRDGFELSGEPNNFSYEADGGNVVTHHFCSSCGAPLFNTNSRFSSAVYVLVGSMEDPSVFQPQRTLFSASAHGWDFTDPELPSFTGMPTK